MMIRLREVRESKQRSLRWLAGAIGVSPQFLSDVERGRRNMSEATLQQAAKILGVQADSIRRMNPNHSMICSNCGLDDDEIHHKNELWCSVGKYIKRR